MSSPQPTWTVTSQNETTAQDQTGAFVPSWQVYYQTQDGTAGSITISKALYTADNVRAKIAAAVAENIAVSQLSG